MKIFDIPSDIHYFNYAGMSPLPVRTTRAGELGVYTKAHPWTINTKEKFFTELDQLRKLFAQLIGASCEDIALVPSATYGVTTAIQHVELNPEDELLVLSEEFPSIYYPFARAAQESGANLNVVTRRPGQSWTEAVCDQISHKTKVLGLSPCHWTDGARVDLLAIREKIVNTECQMIVDGCQWVGASSFDVGLVQPDHLIVPTYKWMLGPYQFGFYYIHPKHQNKKPLEEYWASREQAWDFTKLTDYTDNYQPGARRFDMSERSNFITVPMAQESLKILLELGILNISNRISQVVDKVVDEAHHLNLIVPDKSQRAPHFVGVYSAQGWKPGLQERLAQKNIFLSVRGQCLRIAPHIETTDEDVKALFIALQGET